MEEALQYVFDITMQREGKEIVAYTSGKTFKGFFRRNEDNNNIQDTVKLYYPVNAPVRQGDIIVFNNKKYILFNQETQENTCYYKSAAYAINGKILLNDGSLEGIPCYAYDLNNGLNQGNAISILSGNMDFLTEDNEISRKIKINDIFNEYGRTWHIDNIYYKDGITHIIAQVTNDEEYKENLAMSLVINNSYTVGDTALLQAILYVNEKETEGTVQWTASDSDVVSINDSGEATFLKVGIVKFTAKWIEKNMEKTSDIVIINEKETHKPVITATISGKNSIIPGFSRSYTVSFVNEAGNEVNDIDFQWKVTPSFDTDDLSYTSSGNALKITLEENYDLIEETITLQVIYDGNVIGQKIIEIANVF